MDPTAEIELEDSVVDCPHGLIPSRSKKLWDGK